MRGRGGRGRGDFGQRNDRGGGRGMGMRGMLNFFHYNILSPSFIEVVLLMT